MTWFNKNKPVKQEFMFSKNINYKNYSILIWIKKDDTNYSLCINDFSFTILFQTGWRVNNYGNYNTGVLAEGLQDNLDRHIIMAKKYIDAKIEEPNNIKTALDIVNNLQL
jgi:hypothetical protein